MGGAEPAAEASGGRAAGRLGAGREPGEGGVGQPSSRAAGAGKRGDAAAERPDVQPDAVGRGAPSSAAHRDREETAQPAPSASLSAEAWAGAGVAPACVDPATPADDFADPLGARGSGEGMGAYLAPEPGPGSAAGVGAGGKAGGGGQAATVHEPHAAESLGAQRGGGAAAASPPSPFLDVHARAGDDGHLPPLPAGGASPALRTDAGHVSPRGSLCEARTPHWYRSCLGRHCLTC